MPRMATVVYYIEESAKSSPGSFSQPHITHRATLIGVCEIARASSAGDECLGICLAGICLVEEEHDAAVVADRSSTT